MKKKIYVSLIALTVITGAGYTGYKYTMNLAAKSISNMLANEDFVPHVKHSYSEQHNNTS